MTKTTNTDIQDKIQKLELDTVKAVTGLQKDVQILTSAVSSLTEQIKRMSENYVTMKQHTEDISDLKSDLKIAKRVGMVRSILFSVLTALLTAITIFEITKAISS